MTGIMKRALYVLLPISLAASSAKAQGSYDLRSPNNRVELRIRTANGIRYDVLLGGRAILQDCTLSLDVDHKKLGAEAKVLKHKESSQDRVLEPVVRQKFAKIRENYKELHLDLDGGYSVTFRAYNEGAAYRLETSLPQAEVTIYGDACRQSSPHLLRRCRQSWTWRTARRWLSRSRMWRSIRGCGCAGLAAT